MKGEGGHGVGDLATIALLAAVAAIRWLPYLLGEPGWLMDDWLFVDRAQRLGAWETAGGGLTTARPGSRIVYMLTFGVTQAPVALAVVLALLNVAVALVLWKTAVRWLPTAHAVVVAAVWLLVPTHAAGDYWAATIPIAVSLLLLITGVWGTSVAYRDARNIAGAAVLLVASVAVYELTLGLAGAALIAVPLLERRPIRWPATVVATAGLLAVAAWSARYAMYSGGRWVDAPDLLAMNLSVWGPLSIVVVALLLGIAAVACWREFHGEGWAPGRLLAAGAAVLVVGAAPAARFPWPLTGFGDRVNVASAIGAAMMLAAAMWALQTVFAARWTMAAVLVVVASVASVERAADYTHAAEEGRTWLSGTPEAPLPHVEPGGVYPFCCDGDRDAWDALAPAPAARRASR